MCSQVLLKEPAHADALHCLGLIALQKRQFGLAVERIGQAVEINPDSAYFCNNLSVAHAEQGDFEASAECCRKALRLKPDYAEAYGNLGNALKDQGKADEALENYGKALQLNSNNAVMYNNIGVVLQSQGKIDEAMEHYLTALRLEPGYDGVRKTAVSAIKSFHPTVYQPAVVKFIEDCLASSSIRYQSLAPIAAAQIRLKYFLKSETGGEVKIDENLIREISLDGLFVSFLEKCVNQDAELEVILTRIRRAFLLSYESLAGDSAAGGKFLSALALQCFHNEFVFWADADEKDLVSDLKRTIETRVESGECVSGDVERLLLVFGMYEPLYELACASTLQEMALEAWSPHVQAVIQRTLLELLEEEKFKENFETLGNIEDAVSQAVRSQYEENPYPRWRFVPSRMQESLASSLQAQFPHLRVPEFLKGTVQMLSAGCGTGEEPITFSRCYSNLDVLAVDLSRGSLAYARRMAQMLEIENIRFLHGDILNLTALDRKFHIVLSGGVLHHMERPSDGLKVLSNLLVPGGLMFIGLYSEVARRYLYHAREKFEEMNLPLNTENMRRFRKEILACRENSAWRRLLNEYDFYSMSNCRDLIFHVQEHRFTPPKIKEFLEEQDLEFLGFVMPDEKVKQAYMNRFPEDSNMTDLDSWEGFEELCPDTFARMYVFWCQKRSG